MNWAGLDWSQVGLLIGLKLAIRFPGAGWSWLGWLLTCLRHPSSRLSLSCSHSTDRVPRKGKETCKYFIQVSVWVKFVLPIGQNMYHSQAQCHCQRTLSKACVQKGGIMQMSSCHLGSWPFTVYTKENLLPPALRAYTRCSHRTQNRNSKKLGLFDTYVCLTFALSPCSGFG